jgi:4-hydroxyphenylpyruvate dioxygenase
MSDLLLDPASLREPVQASYSDAHNPLGQNGIEFVEYACSAPQALGQVLEMMGFRPVARHRSREVMLYRQGGLNIVVNAHPSAGADAPSTAPTTPTISALALRVRNAYEVHRHVLDRGGWDAPSHPRAMELNIPAIHGVGGSRIHFVDRYREFSIYDVDFVPVPTVAQRPEGISGLHFFGVVQYIGFDRTDDWIEFYAELLGTTLIPDKQRYGILPAGKLLQAPATEPANGFMLQLVEPPIDVEAPTEHFQRIGLGVPDVLAAVRTLRALGMEFVETDAAHTGRRGALTKTYLGGVAFELVQSGAAP